MVKSPPQTITNQSQINHKTITKQSQNNHKTITKQSQINHKTITNQSQNNHKTIPHQSNKMFSKKYFIPVAKDWAFRSRNSIEELFGNHPKVSDISIEPREKSQPNSSGMQMVRVTLTGCTQDVVEDCFLEGKQKILDSFEYDRKKQERNRYRRKMIGDKKLKIAQDAILEKFEGPKDERILRKDNALTAKLKIAMNKRPRKNQSSFPKIPNTTSTTTRIKKSNPFGALMEESDDEEDIERQHSQAARNNERQDMRQIKIPVVSTKTPTQPVLTGWAKLASKPATPKLQQEPQIAKHEIFEDIELVGGWEMNPDEW